MYCTDIKEGRVLLDEIDCILLDTSQNEIKAWFFFSLELRFFIFNFPHRIRAVQL